MHLNLLQLLKISGEAHQFGLDPKLFSGAGLKGIQHKKHGLFLGELDEAKQKLSKTGARPGVLLLPELFSKNVVRAHSKKTFDLEKRNSLAQRTEPKTEPSQKDHGAADLKSTDLKAASFRPHLKVVEAVSLLKQHLEKLEIKVKTIAFRFDGADKDIVHFNEPTKIANGKEQVRKPADASRVKSGSRRKNSFIPADGDVNKISPRDSEKHTTAKASLNGVAIQEASETQLLGTESRAEFSGLPKQASVPLTPPSVQSGMQSSQAVVFLEKVSQQLEAQAAASQKRFEIQIDVDKLGKLKVGANQVNQDVHIQIFVESPEAKRWLENHLRPLFDSLSHNQVTVDSIEVSVREEDEEAMFPQHHHHTMQNESASGRQNGVAGDGGSSQKEIYASLLQRDFGYNTIEVWA